jgi:hypothetical protein
MKLTLIASFVLVAFTALVARTRRNHTAHPERLDPAVLAAMTAEAERIAAPLRRHVAVQLAALDLPCGEEFGGDFPDVEALLSHAGLTWLL